MKKQLIATLMIGVFLLAGVTSIPTATSIISNMRGAGLKAFWCEPKRVDVGEKVTYYVKVDYTADDCCGVAKKIKVTVTYNGEVIFQDERSRTGDEENGEYTFKFEKTWDTPGCKLLVAKVKITEWERDPLIPNTMLPIGFVVTRVGEKSDIISRIIDMIRGIFDMFT